MNIVLKMKSAKSSLEQAVHILETPPAEITTAELRAAGKQAQQVAEELFMLAGFVDKQ